MEDIYKTFKGFNTDLIKPGGVFYVSITNNVQPVNDTPTDYTRTIEGNVIILRADPISFEFQRASDMRTDKAILIWLVDVEDGLITINEMRELK